MSAGARNYLVTSIGFDRVTVNLARDWMLLSRAPVPVPITGPVVQALFNGTGGNDNFSGTAGEDGFDMVQGGNDTVKGKGDIDIFLFGAEFTAADRIDGRTDTDDLNPLNRDWLYIDGDYSAGVVF